ncbi:Ig-like domain-containing protein, partial [Xanthocytophaga flava]|uniref:Ig-like domain-containing protein n=1 Tax=Xanthocytophaga flava TaxID=3048013 RepID=UPI0028D8F90E
GTAQPQGLQLTNNHHSEPFAAIPSGATVSNNTQTTPALLRSGSLPLPYLSTTEGSNLIDAGTSNLPTAPLAMSYSGNGPDIGAYESGTIVSNQPPSVTLTTPIVNASYPIGSNIDFTATATDADGSIAKVEFYAGSTKVGEKISSPYSFSWNATTAGSYAITAKATDNAGGVTTSTTVNITITAVNENPVVAISSPGANTSLTVGEVVSIAVNASDSDGSIAKVEFYAGSTKIGESTTAPYTIDWTPSAAGNYALTVKATDDKGGITTSSSVNIIINAVVTNQPPVIAINSPSNNSTSTEGDVITITAVATDSDGSITKIEFFAGTTKIGETTTSPYSLSWSNVTNGTYTLTVKATDDKGSVTTSAPVNVIVKAIGVEPKPNQTPVVAISSPTSAVSLTEGESLTFVASASDSDGSITKVEFYAGSTKIGESTTSPYSVNWTNITKGTYSVTAKAIDNENASAISQAITVNVGTKPNQLPVISITSPASGTDLTEGTTLSITTNVTDSDGTLVKVEFYANETKIGEAASAPWSFSWANLSAGAYALTAKAIDNKGGSNTSAVVNINVATKVTVPRPTPNQVPVVSITSPANNTAFVVRNAVSIIALASDSDGSIAKVEFYVGSAKIGETTSAPYSISWIPSAIGSYALTAKAIDNQSGASTSSVVNVTITAPANQLPSITLTAPTTNASYPTGSSINLTATATDADGSIAKVEFYVGSTKVGEKASSPYSFSWKATTAGSYAITAKAIDNAGGVTTSSAVNVTVTAPNQAPSIAITSPAMNSTYILGNAITINTSTSDADGKVSKIEFYAGSTKIGESTIAPYTLNWTPSAAGTYALTAKATDDKGGVTTSAVVSIVIKIATVNQPPVVVIKSPATNTSFISGNTVTITTNASDSDGSIAKVEFYANNSKIGESTNAPYSINWNAVSLGTYSVTAKATDNSGATTTSTPVVITVKASVVETPTPSNNAPTIRITTPAANSVYTTGQNITIMTDAKDVDGTIQKVEFFVNDSKITEKSTSPWNTATTLKEGTYTLTAKATDNKGAVTTSAPVTIVINATSSTTNTLPVVSITSPSNNATFTEGGTAPITATARDNDGSIAKVEFYANNIKIGEATSAPYAFNWSSLVIGTYALTAKAIDNRGGISTSSPVTIVVKAAPVNQPPVIAITAPSNNQTFTAGESITVTATATDNDGQVIKVEFYAGTTKIGETMKAPYTITWKDVQKGTYALTALAYDDNGASTTSAVVTVVVKEKSTPGEPEPETRFYRAINLNGPGLTIDGHEWGGSNAANYTYSGTSMEKTSIALSPATDENRTSMIHSSITGRNVNVALTSVPNATYDVYLYVWEEDAMQIYSVYLEGKTVQSNYTSGSAGTWKRLGPFRETIKDNTINVKTSGGYANVSGIEVWTVSDDNAVPTTCSATGYILREEWNNIAVNISEMVPAYKKPDNSSQLTLFEAPSNVGDNYRSRIRGYICPPVSGTYTFWIAGDAEAELWLSSDESPATKTQIAYVSEATNPREWGKSATQRSAAITLIKGKKYYIEAIHKAGEGNDNLAVGWQIPGGIQELPIAGSRLSPYVPTEAEFESPSITDAGLTLYPNPADSEVNVQFSVNEDQNAIIALTNMTTQQVIQITQSVQAGENTVRIDVANLAKGMYIVYVKTKEGRLSKKLVVTR